MIDIREIEVDDYDWQDALYMMPAKGYRRTRNGTFETFVSYHCDCISLGTYATEIEAKEAVFNYRIERLLSGLEEYGLDADYSTVFMKRYLAFPNGMIFNLHGERMRGCIGRDGYVHGIFNGVNINFHRIIATCFIPNPYEKEYVNHINGLKYDNRVENLEWCTRSENTIHSFRNGLQRTINGNYIFTDDEKDYMWEHCYEHFRDVAAYLGRNPQTVRKYLERYRKEKQND